MRDGKGMNAEGRGGGEELARVKEGKTAIKIYCRRKSSFNKKRKRKNKYRKIDLHASH